MVQNADGGGARPATATTIPDSAASGQARPRRRHGRCWDCWRRATRGRTRWPRGYGAGVEQFAERDLDESAEGRNGEAIYTGTGFPRVFYLAYHLYRDYFPLLALTTYKRVMEREVGAA